MKAGIVGLGLIGGSFARAYHAAGWEVLAFNRTRDVLDQAIDEGVVDGELTDEALSSCDIVLVSIYPDAAIDFIREHADSFGRKPVVMDCCGTKRKVCDACFPIAEEHHFTYIGTHPMAGKQYSGYDSSRADLYVGAPMVLVLPPIVDTRLLDKAIELLGPCGFGFYSVTSASKHDELIAFTSQMAHIASNAYIKSPTAKGHRGFSAGSYKDMTRVAWLNPTMWAELFMDNRDYLLNELNTYIWSLSQYRDALQAGDMGWLTWLLEEGRDAKEEVDGAYEEEYS